MPFCIVPLCNRNEKSGVSFHRVPADPNERKKWIKLIRRENYVWKVEDRVCGWHFPNGRSKDKLPSRFEWNKNKLMILSSSPIKNEQPAVNVVPDSKREVAVQCFREPVISPLQEIRNKRKRGFQEGDTKIIIEKQIIDSLQADNKHLKIMLDTKEKYIAELHARLKEVGDTLREIRDCSKLEKIETLDIPVETPIFDNNSAQLWSAEVWTSFTGFQDKSSMAVVASMLHSKYAVKSGHKSKVVEGRVSVENQILITLMKLRTDLTFEALGYMFRLSSKTISTIFQKTIKAIFEMFYEGEGPLASLPSRFKTAQYIPDSFRNMRNCRVVIDCTEFVMETPNKMDQKKNIYSHYKHRYTAKVLIGCAPNGTALFVSDLFGGSESDKSIVLKSGLLDKLESGDMILADKGFQLYDILPPGVSLNIPSFLCASQFSTNEIISNIEIARARVIVERLNARFKIFRMLDCIKCEHRYHANEIVKVCVALTLLMPTLVKEVLK